MSSPHVDDAELFLAHDLFLYCRKGELALGFGLFVENIG
jgi:hypothetical protein